MNKMLHSKYFMFLFKKASKYPFAQNLFLSSFVLWNSHWPQCADRWQNDKPLKTWKPCRVGAKLLPNQHFPLGEIPTTFHPHTLNSYPVLSPNILGWCTWDYPVLLSIILGGRLGWQTVICPRWTLWVYKSLNSHLPSPSPTHYIYYFVEWRLMIIIRKISHAVLATDNCIFSPWDSLKSISVENYSIESHRSLSPILTGWTGKNDCKFQDLGYLESHASPTNYFWVILYIELYCTV